MRKNKDKEIVEKKCSMCGITFETNHGYVRKVKPDHIWRCKDCLRKHRSNIQKNSKTSIGNIVKKKLNDPNEKEKYLKMLAERAKKQWESLSEEEKNNKVNILHQGLQKAWIDNREEFSENRRNHMITYNSNMSEEDRKDLSRKISEGRKRYFENLTEEEKEKISIERKKFWEDSSDDFKEMVRQNTIRQWENYDEEKRKTLIEELKENGRNFWDKVTEEERLVIGKKISEKNKERCKRLSLEEFQNIELETAKASNNSDKEYSLNKTEAIFGDILIREKISYNVQHYNTDKHEYWDKLFPLNPVTGSKFISPYHQWDFLIKTKQKNILVDIDGSIHKLPDDSFKKLNNFNKYIYFYDSQRPYQTDGLEAYIIKCYDDTLTDETEVVSVNDDSMKLTFKQFMFKLLDYNKDTID